jgi:excisionase family DNA binding protein
LEKRLLTVREAAALSGISRQHFYRLIHAKALDDCLVHVPGCHLLIRREPLLRWLDGLPV